jgi:hypothetical protein
MFHIFYKPILVEYVFQVKRGPHLFQSCLNVAQDGLPLAIRGMDFSFENLVVTGTSGFQASLMDIHHNTSLRCILEDDSISLASKAYIHYFSSKGVGLKLDIKSFIHLFRITHYTFTSALHFDLNLI